jgi:hypothetical protein
MTNPESINGITHANEEVIVSQFPDGSRTERQGDVTYIYDASGKRRWFIHDFVMDWERKRHLSLELQGETSGGTWHLLMGVYQARNADTGEEIDTGVTVDVISGTTSSYDDTTPNRNIQYSAVRQGIFFEGWGGGYYGRREAIVEDLEEMGALAKTPDELPPKIDVYGTVQQLAQTFWDGRFDPPQFVVPEEPTNRQKLKTAAKTIYQRLSGRKGTKLQKKD